MLTVKNNLFSKKFIVFFIVLSLVIIAFVLFFVCKKHEDDSANLETFCSADEAISMSIYDTLGFSEYKDDSYVLAFKSTKIDSEIYVSKFLTTNIRDVSKFVEADKNDYISKFSNINQVSDIYEYTFHGFKTYNCHFNYKENMYVDVYWILKDSDLYVIDFNVNMEKGDLFSHISGILDSLKFN